MSLNAGEVVYRILGDDSGFQRVLSGAGSAAVKVINAASKAAMLATSAASAAVAALAKAAIDSYAEYEQLVGGVETLFDTSAETVRKYADEAYKTAGMSANAYMSTVTSFSASLLQGLGGNTAAAADIANQAIIDMSDNANKMGTDMSLIQNAYQGFAKQNYTMLDNLRIGYGGTQSEMARLINDSGVLGDSMTVTAETVNSVSFDKIIEAIHVIQDNMGITGTTAKEAASTIQGSIAAMRGSWTNFMVGMADPTQDFDTLTSNLIDSVLTVADNLLPRIQALLPQLARGFTELAEGILPLVPETLEAMLPDVLDVAVAIVESLLNVIADAADTSAPVINKAAPEIIGAFIDGIGKALPAVASAAVDIISGLTLALFDNADEIMQAAVDIIITLADGISENLPELIPAAVKAVMMLADTLLADIPLILETAEKLIIALGEGIGTAVPTLIEYAPRVIEKLCYALTEAVPDFADNVPAAICTGIADGLMNYDWSTAAENAMVSIANALDNAQKNVQIGLDYLLSDGELYGGDTANVSSTDFINTYRSGINDTVNIIKDGQQSILSAYNEGKDILQSTVESNSNNVYDSQNAYNDAIINNHRLAAEEYREAQLDAAHAMADSSEEADGIISKASEKTEAELKKEAQALKAAVSHKVQALEIRQLEEGLSDEWLYDEWENIIADLDRNSDLYLDNYQKILEGRSRINEQKKKDQEAADKAELDAAEKQRTALKKSYEALSHERDSLASGLALGGDLFRTAETADRRTGEIHKDRKIGFEEFEKKLAAKKQLTSKIAELLEKNTPDSIISQLLSCDPVDALYYANELLRSPDKLNRLAAGFEKDAVYSKAIADMVTEHSEDFSSLGTEAGYVFSDSFIEAFRSDWESAFSDVFSEEYSVNAAAAVSSANSSAANENTYVRHDYSDERSDSYSKTRKTTASGNPSEVTVRVLDINGAWLAKAVKRANDQKAITGGG